MARMTDEQREQRTLLRARRAAEAAEEEDRRTEERRQQWQREGTYMSWAEIEAGEPCRGCGQPLLDGMGGWPPLLKLTPDRGLSATGRTLRSVNGTPAAGRAGGA